ncbi:MAG: V-type ATP synthase subunit I [Sphaerochaetaceae bacterium]
MKKVSVIVLAANKKQSLQELRAAGLLHITDRVLRNEHIDDLLKKHESIEKAIVRIQEAVASQSPAKKGTVIAQNHGSLVVDDFAQLLAKAHWLIEEESILAEKYQKNILLCNQMAKWGDFSPSDIATVNQYGIGVEFYWLARKDVDDFGDDTRFIRLSNSRGMQLIALVDSKLPDGVLGEHMVVPQASLSEIQSSIMADRQRLDEVAQELSGYGTYLEMFRKELAINEQESRFEAVSAAMGTNERVGWITGFLPSDTIETFKNLASEKKWGYLIDDPSEEDEVPTLVRNKRWISIIEPVFSIMGTVPGYHEYDISMWFLVFFSLFFAMIIGDAAYGVIFLAIGVLVHRKIGKLTNAVILLYVLSIATILWGSVTGTWFGSKKILESLPFLQYLVIPSLSNYPELFNLTSKYAQDSVMKFCFIVGTLQLSLACVMNILKKLPKRDLSAVGDFGWLIMIDSLYFLVLMLVVRAEIDTVSVAAVVAVGFVLVVMFGGQKPGIPFAKGLAMGVAGLFTTFLNSISAFSNIVSYIRLFAVGMASLAIAQSFNSMADGLLHGLALPAGILVLVIGHGLNLVMGLLSVVVHGVRLNLLEFSGQLGMEWTGVIYDPFRETVEKSQTL